MEKNTSCRLSTNSYDTATEESISMYYSFNGTVDKTLENSELNLTGDETIEETLNTIVKMPLNVTPIKAKSTKCLQLSGFSSTPTDRKVRNKNHQKETPVNEFGFQALSEVKQVENTETELLEISSSLETLIVDSLNEIRIETSPDNSPKFSKESVCEVGKSSKNTLNVLQEASSKIWPINNQTDDLINENEDFNKSISELERIAELDPVKNSNRYSLAEKMVKEIQTLMKDTTESSQHLKQGKENFEITTTSDKPSVLKSNVEKDFKNNRKSVSHLIKPSRLSVRTRRSILESNHQTMIKTFNITQTNTKMSQNSSKLALEKSTSSNSSTDSTNVSSQMFLPVIPEINKQQVNMKRRSFLPSKRFSTVNGNKDVLKIIPEAKKESHIVNKRQTLSFKRLSSMPAKPYLKTDSIVIAKTTLNSPVNAKRHNMRRSVVSSGRFTTSARSIPTNSKKEDLKTAPSTSNRRAEASSETKIESLSLGKPKTSFTKVNPFSREDFICEICSRSFRVSSIFEAHKKTHNPLSAKQGNKCKYCDKSFAIMQALDKHLLENCLKIPLADRKRIKLAAAPAEEKYTRENAAPNTNKKNIGHSQRNSILPKSRDRMSFANILMPPPTSAKVKKNVAHSGISRTPTKTVACKQCDKSFDNVLLFAEHVLSHSTGNIASTSNEALQLI